MRQIILLGILLVLAVSVSAAEPPVLLGLNEPVPKVLTVQDYIFVHESDIEIKDKIHISVDTEKLERVSILSEDDTFRFIGDLRPVLTFTPQIAGNYKVEGVTKEGEIVEYSFTVRDKDIPSATSVLVEPKKRYGQYMAPSEVLTIKNREREDVFTYTEVFNKNLSNDTKPTTVRINESRYVELEPQLRKLKKIRLENVTIKPETELKIDEKIPFLNIRLNGKQPVDAFAIDPSGVEFKEGWVSGVAKGNELWKCVDWDFENQVCNGEWKKLRNIAPGKEYNFRIDSKDPGFLETLDVLDVQSYPITGGNWTVRFKTTGTADLQIRASNGTTWSQIGGAVDLQFLELKCDGLDVPFQWINNSVFVEDYSCSNTSLETVKVITTGTHTIQFRFGNEIEYANNYASATGILLLRNTLGGQSTNSQTVGNNITFNAQDRIDAIYSHNSGEENITVNTDGVYRITYGYGTQRTTSTRVENNGRLYINGNVYWGCWGSTYTRGGNDAYDGVVNSDCLVELSANDEIWINNLRTGTITEDEPTVANRIWLDMQRLNFTDVIMVHDGTGGQSMNNVEGINLTWDTVDRTSGTYSFTAGSDNITVNREGLYRVTYGVSITDVNNRYSGFARVLVNGQVANAGNSYAYLRSTEGTENMTASSSFLVDLNSGDNLKVLAGRESDSSIASVITHADQSWWQIERIEDNRANVLISYDSTGGENVDSITPIDINFDTTTREDSFFSKTDVEAVEILQSGLYRVSYGIQYNRLLNPTDETRLEHLAVVRVDGSNSGSCWSQSYNRGDNGPDTYQSHASSSCIINLTAGEELTISTARTSSASADLNTSTLFNSFFHIEALDAINEPPEVNLKFPPSGSTNTSSTITFGFNYTDDQTTSATCSLWHNASGIFTNITKLTNVPDNTLQTVFLAVGTDIDIVWNVQCTDIFNDSAFASSNYTLRIDGAPKISLDYPPDQSGDNDGKISFNYTVNDIGNVQNCSLFLNSLLLVNETNPVVGVERNFTVMGLSEGTYEWYVQCYDSQGTQNKSTNRTVDVILSTNFDGSTTDFSTVNTGIIPNLQIENTTNGLINYTQNINLSGGANLDSLITITDNSIAVDSVLEPRLNKQATLSFYGLSYSFDPVLLLTGTVCGSCGFLSYSGGTARFTVPGFTTYVTTTNSQLIAFDDSDPLGGGINRFPNEQVGFFVNYSNRTSGVPIQGSGRYCEISFEGVLTNMTYNSSSGLYEYNRSFSSKATYQWNASCVGSNNGYEDLSAEDSIIIRSPPIQWWDEDYQYRRQITVETGANSPYRGYENYTIRIITNTSGSEYQNDGDDVRIVYFNGISNVELDRVNITSFDSTTTELRFGLYSNISANSFDDNYFVYYGNPSATTPPKNPNNVYLWFDNATTDSESSYTQGKVDDTAHGNAFGNSVTHNTGGYYDFDTGDNFADSLRPSNVYERDVFVEYEDYHTAAYPVEMTSGPITRLVISSGSAGTEVSDHFYYYSISDSPLSGGGPYPDHDDIVAGDRGSVVMANGLLGSISSTQYTRIGLATWGINPTRAKTFYDDPSGGWSTYNWNSSNASDYESPGEAGLWLQQEAGQIRNILIRRYTEPEPTLEESTQSERKPPRINFPTLNVTLINQSKTVRFNVSLTDENGVSAAYLTLRFPNGTLVNKTVNLFENNEWDYTIFETNATGQYNITVISANDTIGLRNTTISTLYFNVTPSPPFPFNITLPANNTEARNLIPTVAWENTVEDDFANYTLLFDKDSTFGSPDFTYKILNTVLNTSFTVPFALDSNSIYYIRVSAHDIFGSITNATRDITYITDTFKPNVLLVLPGNNTVTNGSLNFNYSVTEANTLGACELYGNFSTLWEKNQTNTSLTSGSHIFNTVFYNEGGYIWNVICRDLAQNNGTFYTNLSFVVDRSGPNITLLNPPNSFFETTTNNIDFTVRVNDTYSNVSECRLVINNETQSIESPFVEDIEYNFTTFLSNGNYTWYINCTDSFGFVTQSGLRDIEISAIDNDPPLITPHYPIDIILNVTNATFNYTPEDATGIANCSLYLDGRLNKTCGGAAFNTMTVQAESGEATMSGTATSTTTSLTNTYNLDRTFVRGQFHSGVPASASGTNPANHYGLTYFTSPSSLEHRRSSGTSNIGARATYNIIQADNIRTCFFNHTWTSGSTVADVDISSCSYQPSDFENKCFLEVQTLTDSTSGSCYQTGYVNAEMTNSSNINLRRDSTVCGTAPTGQTIGHRVCFIDNTKVVHGTLINSGVSTGTTENLGTTVNTSNAFVVFNYLTTDNGLVQVSLRGTLTGTSSLLFDRVSTGTAPGIINASWYVIEFEPSKNSFVDREQALLLSGDTVEYDFNLTNVFESNRSIAVCSNNYQSGTGTAFPRTPFTGYFLNESVIRMNKGRTGTASQTPDITCEAILWPNGTSVDPADPCVIENLDVNKFNISNMTEGNHIWNLTCTDSSNGLNVGWSEDVNFTIDLTTPRVWLNTPENNSFYISSTVQFNYTPSDINLNNCSLFLNSSNWRPNLTLSVPTITNDQPNIFSKGLADGDYLWNVRCFDLADQFAFNSTNYTVRVDTDAPEFSSVNISPSSPADYIPQGNYYFNITWTDENGVNEVRLEHNFTGLLVNTTLLDSGGGIYNFSTSDLAVGTYSYKWYANDSASLSNQTQIFVFVVNKADSEVGLLLNGTDGPFEIEQNTEVNISANIVTPSSGYIEIYVNGTRWNNGTAPLENVSFFAIPGVYNITAIYNQTANYSASFETHLLNVTDTTDPVVTYTFPPNDTTVGVNAFSFQYVVSDLSGINNCSLFIDSAFNSSDDVIQKGPVQTFPIDLPDGNYTWEVICVDSFGNQGTGGVYDVEVLEIPIVNATINVTNNTYEIGEDSQITGRTSDQINNPLETNTTISIIYTNRTVSEVPWWDGDYSRRQILNVTTGPTSPYNGYEDYTVQMNIDTSVSGFLANGNDLRIIYWNGTGNQELDRVVINPGTGTTTVRFRLQTNISASDSDLDYYLYHNNTGASAPTTNLSEVYLWYDDGSSDREYQYTQGRIDSTCLGGGWQNSIARSISGYYNFDTEDNFCDSMRPTSLSERDVYVEYDEYQTGAYPNEMTSGPVTRIVISSGILGTEDSSHWYSYTTADSTYQGTAYGWHDDVVYDDVATGTVAVENGLKGALPATTNVRLGMATWGVNPTNIRTFYNNESGGWGGFWFNGTHTGTNDNEQPGDVGVWTQQDQGRIDNILIRRYTQPEPVITLENIHILKYYNKSNSGIDGLVYVNWSTSGQPLGNYSVTIYGERTEFVPGHNFTSFDLGPDTTPPNVTLIAPEDNFTSGVGEFNFTFRPFDFNLDNCTLYYGSGLNPWAPRQTIEANSTINNKFSNVYLSTGIYDWNVLCTDTFGNSGFAVANWTVNITGPDFFINFTDIWFSDDDRIEGNNITVFANFTNIGLTDANETFVVQFYKGDPQNGGVQINGNKTFGGLNISQIATMNVSVALDAGYNRIYVTIDPDDRINESDQRNNNASNNVTVSLYQYFYGNVSAGPVLGSNESFEFLTFLNDSDNTGHILVGDADSIFSFSDLVALTRTSTGSPTATDFTEFDSLLNTSDFNDSIKNVFGGGTDTPLQTRTFTLGFGAITNVPFVNTTDSTSFVTGILWDSGDDTSLNNQFDTTDREDILFITEINTSKSGKYGTYDYEIRVPSKIMTYKTGTTAVTFFYELN